MKNIAVDDERLRAGIAGPRVAVTQRRFGGHSYVCVTRRACTATPEDCSSNVIFHSLPYGRIGQRSARERYGNIMANLDTVKALLRAADGISFDVDSTVIQEEGIDELAKFCGKGDDVAALTKQAMQGNMSFRESLGIRLNIIRPTQNQVKDFIRTHPVRLTPGIKTLVDTIQSQNKQVFLISGGFYSLIVPVAAQLNIPPENIFANKLKFYFTGEYAGFDENQPTSRSGGKCDVIKELKDKRLLKTIVHIGDGATDLEVLPPADTFIGYGGNIIREDVKARAPWFITDFNELVKVLEE